MSDHRKRSAIWAFSATALLAVALLSATALTGAGNETSLRIVGGVVSALSFVLGSSCLGLALRATIRMTLTGVGSRLQRQADHLDGAQDRRHAELMTQMALSCERRLETLHDAAEASKAISSIARSLRLQTEAIAVIRKQTRASMEGLEGISTQVRAAQAAAVDGRDTSRKLLNLVRGESKSSRKGTARFAEEASMLRVKLDEAEAGQRRILNYLRREGNIQVVLDRLQASERRLLTSVEGGTLTIAEELANSVRQGDESLLGEIRMASKDMDHLRGDLSAIESELKGARPRAEELLAEVNGVAQSVAEVRGSVLDIGRENVNALAQLTESTKVTFDRVEWSLQQTAQVRDDSQERTKSTYESQETVAHLLSALHSSFDGLQARWDALQDEWTVISDSGLNKPVDDGVEEQTTDVVRTLNSLVRLTDVLKNDVKSLHRHVDRSAIDTVRQTEALMQLLPRVNSNSKRLPASGGFAMTPDSLLLLSDLIAGHKPKTILELGSGTSTIWMGIFAARIGSSVVSIEHLEEYRERTQKDLSEFGLGDVVDLRLAELETTKVLGERTIWYAQEPLDDVQAVDLLIIDGPPESTGPTPRSPSFPLLREKLSDHAFLVVDDVHRDQEAQMVEEWLALDRDLARVPLEASRTRVLEYRRNRRQASDSKSHGG